MANYRPPRVLDDTDHISIWVKYLVRLSSDRISDKHGFYRTDATHSFRKSSLTYSKHPTKLVQDSHQVMVC